MVAEVDPTVAWGWKRTDCLEIVVVAAAGVDIVGETEKGVPVGVEMGDVVEMVVVVADTAVAVVDIEGVVVVVVGYFAGFVVAVAEPHFELAILLLSIAPNGTFGAPKEKVYF